MLIHQIIAETAELYNRLAELNRLVQGIKTGDVNARGHIQANLQIAMRALSLANLNGRNNALDKI